MWGYSIAAASLGIKHKLVGDFQVQQGIPVIPKAQHIAYQKENLDLFGWELSQAPVVVVVVVVVAVVVVAVVVVAVVVGVDVAVVVAVVLVAVVGCRTSTFSAGS